MTDTTTTTRTHNFGSTIPRTPRTPRWLPATVLAAVRLVVGFLFACHGFQGLFGHFGGIDGAGTPVPSGEWPGWWGALIELVAGGLIMLGLFTTIAAVICSGVMAFAYFTVHQPMALSPLENFGEQAAVYSWVFLLIAVLGPGAWALDNLRKRTE